MLHLGDARQQAPLWLTPRDPPGTNLELMIHLNVCSRNRQDDLYCRHAE